MAENFNLRGLEEWALRRSEARKEAEKSPYDFDDLLEDDESVSSEFFIAKSNIISIVHD